MVTEREAEEARQAGLPRAPARESLLPPVPLRFYLSSSNKKADPVGSA
jgi:hypothetical protein